MTKKLTKLAPAVKFTYQELKALKTTELSELNEKDFNLVVARLGATNTALDNNDYKGLDKANISKIAPSVAELVLEENELRQPTKAPEKAPETKKAPEKAPEKEPKPKEILNKIDVAGLVGKEIKMLMNHGDEFQTRDVTITYYEPSDESIEVRYFEKRGKKENVKVQDTFFIKHLNAKMIAVRNDSYFFGLLQLK